MSESSHPSDTGTMHPVSFSEEAWSGPWKGMPHTWRIKLTSTPQQWCNWNLSIMPSEEQLIFNKNCPTKSRFCFNFWKHNKMGFKFLSNRMMLFHDDIINMGNKKIIICCKTKMLHSQFYGINATLTTKTTRFWCIFGWLHLRW